MVVQRSDDFRDRIESFAHDSIALRLASCLLRFSGRLGQVNRGGLMETEQLTHELLSQFVGTLRGNWSATI